MNLMNNKGFTILELLIAIAIGTVIILAVANIDKIFTNNAKSIELKENTRVLIDKELMAMSKRAELNDHAEIKRYAEATCSSLGLKYTYDPASKKFHCMLMKYSGCKAKSPCLVSIKDGLCELQKRSKVSIRHACSL